MDWMMEDGYGKLDETHNIEKSGHLDLSGGRSPEGEE